MVAGPRWGRFISSFETDPRVTAPDFKARITILTEEEGGRRSPPHNFIRWDFGYLEDPPGSDIYMIWPLFVDENEPPLPTGVPISGTQLATMKIVAPQMQAYHRARLYVGMPFHCHEGARIVARGVVTDLLRFGSGK